MQLMGLTISPLAPAVLFEQYRSGTADVVLFEQYRSGTADVVLFEQCRSGPADVVVVCADGLMMVPSSATLRPPSPLATESIGAHLWLAVRLPLLASPLHSSPSSTPLVIRIGGVRLGGEEGGIVLIRRGVTTPVNPTHHSDTGFYCLPSEGWSGFTHMACSPVHVVGRGRVRGPWTRRQHPGKMLSSGSHAIPQRK